MRGRSRAIGRASADLGGAARWAVVTAALSWGGPACGSPLDADAIAVAMQAELRAQGVEASVSCPTNVDVATGDLVTCTAIAVDDPGRTALTVRAQILASGRISLRPEAALAVGRAAPAIRHALAGRGIEAHRIDCSGALATPGDPLRCDIDASDGRRFRWDAVVGADGHARGELVAR